MAARALSTYVLASKNELKRAIGLGTTDTLTDDQEDKLADALEYASAEIEAFLCRLLVTRGAITEYHTASSQIQDGTALYLTQHPVITMTSVTEGYWDSGAWSAQDTLTANEDYASDVAAGTLIRLSGSNRTAWDAGHERVRVVYTAGYATTAAVPQGIRGVCVDLAARKHATWTRGQAGAQSISDGMGSVTRFLPAELLTMEQHKLMLFRRLVTTGRAA
jgi:hypothetical protein